MSVLSDYIEAGLAAGVAVERLAQEGRNELVGKKPTSDVVFLLRQFKSPLVIVLLVAGGITLFLDHATDSIVIGIAVLINTLLGFIQERRAYRSLEALKRVLAPEALVTRGGERIKIDARELVPGDVVWLFEGDKVPGDGVVVEAAELLVREAVLTGESRPVRKAGMEMRKIMSAEALVKMEPGEESRVFMGTVVASGAGRFVVQQTGMRTEMGKIAEQVDEAGEDETPLEKRLGQLARGLTMVVVVAAVMVFGYGMATNQDPVEMFTVSVALAVAAIPEGLVVALTAILAIGMQRILKRKAVVRKLVAAETLGTVTTVCVDKTGTLTEGNMRVVETEFEDVELGVVCSTIANDRLDANELARISWAEEIFESKRIAYGNAKEILGVYPRSEEIPFSSERRFLAVRAGKWVFMSGAPETVLRLAKEGLEMQKGVALETLGLVEKWGKLGRRMIGFGMKECVSVKEAVALMKRLRELNGEVKESEGLRWVGVIALEDPLREGVKEAFEKARKAGLGVKVITGDYQETAMAIMDRLGFAPAPDEVLLGSDLEKMSKEELAKVVLKVKLFARTRPTQKLDIVQALKSQGEVVGMMGDGVNDAPALAAADIGMVVGNATEVAREAADMVLLDSNFDTILAAVEEGRGIFDNLRKVILYLLSDTFSELIIVMGSLFMGWPLAIAAAPILWINLVNDGLPNLALTVDPKADDLLKRKPIRLDMPLINNEMRVLIGVISTITGMSCLLVFYVYWQAYDVAMGRTMVYTVLALDSLLYVFSCRSLVRGIWEEPIWKNPWLLGAAAAGLVLTVVPVYVPLLQEMLGLVPLSVDKWVVAVGISLGVVVMIELVKWLYRRNVRES